MRFFATQAGGASITGAPSSNGHGAGQFQQGPKPPRHNHARADKSSGGPVKSFQTILHEMTKGPHAR